jgi:hypothetical protein
VAVSIPNSSSVSFGFQKLLKRLDAVRKKINNAAARETKDGNYEVARNWMEVGRSVADFRDRAEAFSREWKALVKGIRNTNHEKSASKELTSRKATRGKRLFTWRFCMPILSFIVIRGGTATTEEIIAQVEQNLGSQLTEREKAMSPKTGGPKWHGGMKKAYKHYQREGWIEKRSDGLWKLTSKGKAIAEHEE